MPLKNYLSILFLLNFLVAAIPSFSQPCIDDYFVKNYPTSTVQSISSAAVTANEDIIFTGTVLRRNSILVDGWFTKLTPLGSLLWSKRYSSVNYNDIQFSKVTGTIDGGYILAGYVGEVDTTTIPPSQLTQVGVLIKTDKYGNIVWTKLFGKDYVTNLATTITNVLELANGDLIISIRYIGQISSSIILRTDKDGNLKWTSTVSFIFSTQYNGSFGPLEIKLLKNGSLIFGGRISVYNIDIGYGDTKSGYYFFCLDASSGSKLWDKTFIGIDPPTTRGSWYGDVVNIAELPNGDLSFIASYSDNAFYLFRKSTEVLNFTTDNIGRLKKIQSYSNASPPLYASSASEAGPGGNRTILMDNADAPLMMQLDADGEIKWQKSYAAAGRSQETRSVLSTASGYYFFSFTRNGGSKELKLIKTDISGNADCVQSPFNLTVTDKTGSYQLQDFDIKIDQRPSKWYNVATIGVADYSMSANTVCRKTCCTDTIMPLINIDLCNAPSYTLPNDDVIKVSGTYHIRYKSVKGCDSILAYNVLFSQSPLVALGNNTCLDGKDSVLLKTAPGYQSYTWNGVVSSEPNLWITQPGYYRVSVTNACGIKSDTIQVFQQCEFSILMPNAFTPNSDGHNDVFRIPPQVNNQLISFNIYNRWGQPVFAAKNIGQGWNGNNKGFPAPAGTYVYYIVMQTIDGKKRLAQKGWVTLLR